MEARIVTLASGNKAVFFDYSGVRNFYVTDKNITQFLGGGLGLEAERKERIFTNFTNSVVERTNEFSIDLMYNLGYTNFADKLGSASQLFIAAFSNRIVASDLDDCNGLDSAAKSCGERGRYYRAAGLQQLFGNPRKFHLSLFIANHVTVFGCNNFRDTFFHGSNQEFESDTYITSSGYLTRYNRDTRAEFKAPAYYVRSLVLSKICS